MLSMTGMPLDAFVAAKVGDVESSQFFKAGAADSDES